MENQPLNAFDIIPLVVFANLLTISVVYAVWKEKKDGDISWESAKHLLVPAVIFAGCIFLSSTFASQ